MKGRLASLLVALLLPSFAWSQGGAAGKFEWVFQKDIDPMNDSEILQVFYSNDDIAVGIACNNGGLFTAILPVSIRMGQELSAHPSNMPVEWRVDKMTAHSEVWPTTRNVQTGGYIPYLVGEQLPREALSGEGQLLIRLGGLTFPFPLSGADDKIERVLAACGSAGGDDIGQSSAYTRSDAQFVVSSENPDVLDYVICLEHSVGGEVHDIQAKLAAAEQNCTIEATKLPHSGPSADDIHYSILECGFRVGDGSPDACAP